MNPFTKLDKLCSKQLQHQPRYKLDYNIILIIGIEKKKKKIDPGWALNDG
jgi:hypothetical protein